MRTLRHLFSQAWTQYGDGVTIYMNPFYVRLDSRTIFAAYDTDGSWERELATVFLTEDGKLISGVNSFTTARNPLKPDAADAGVRVLGPPDTPPGEYYSGNTVQ